MLRSPIESAAVVVPFQTGQLTSTQKNSSGVTVTGKTVTCDSANTAVATVSTGGLVSAVAPGTAVNSATSDTAENVQMPGKGYRRRGRTTADRDT